MFDITSVAASETSVLELVSAADEPLLDADGKPLTITLYGPGTTQFARASQRRQNKLLDRLKKKGKADLSPDEQTAEQADFLASVTVSFNGWTYPPAGKATGAELFKAAYKDRAIGFIADQVTAFVGDWANFTKSSDAS
jgi:hypothetical protein